MSEYSKLDQLLHSLALNFTPVRTAAFDAERSLVKINSENIAQTPHVFVTGLARAGTSILLRILYTSGSFACQTYRDMPFILAPQLWRKLSSSWRKSGQSKTRAHGDGLMVDFDSVEAFEEVFWLTFARDLYLRGDHLRAHDIDGNLASLFYDYVAIVIAADSSQGARRYASKNNNNLLRLPGLARAFPAAHIIVPFRAPLQHAFSLLRQHRNFSELQTADPFVERYMRWLGHFEFGRDFRPFTFGDHVHKPAGDLNGVRHWLEHWTRVYQGVLATAPANAIFWDYDAFCADPVGGITRLADLLGLDANVLKPAVAQIRQRPDYANDTELPATLLSEADKTCSEMRRRSQETLR